MATFEEKMTIAKKAIKELLTTAELPELVDGFHAISTRYMNICVTPEFTYVFQKELVFQIHKGKEKSMIMWRKDIADKNRSKTYEWKTKEIKHESAKAVQEILMDLQLPSLEALYKPVTDAFRDSESDIVPPGLEHKQTKASWAKRYPELASQAGLTEEEEE